MSLGSVQSLGRVGSGRGATMCANYPFLFEEECMFLVIDIKRLLHMHMIVCAVCV